MLLWLAKLMDNLCQFVVNSGKLWKNSWKKKQNETDYRKTHGKPPNLMVDPNFFFGLFWQYTSISETHPYVVVCSPHPPKQYEPWSKYEPPTQNDGIEGDLPRFTDILDMFRPFRECVMSRGWDYHMTEPGEDGRCHGSSRLFQGFWLVSSPKNGGVSGKTMKKHIGKSGNIAYKWRIEW